MINFDALKAEFDKRQQERERDFAAATGRAERIFADFPGDLLPATMTLAIGDVIVAQWPNKMHATIGWSHTYLRSEMRGFPDPKNPTTSAEMLAAVVEAMAYKEPCETCTRCGQTVPTRGQE